MPEWLIGPGIGQDYPRSLVTGAVLSYQTRGGRSDEAGIIKLHDRQ